MHRKAGTALSERVVSVESQSRPCDVLDRIENRRATHAIVFDAGQCLGLARLDGVIGRNPQLTFAQLLTHSAPPPVSCELPLEDAARLLDQSQAEALTVSDEQGTIVGAVTRQSLLEAALAQKELFVRLVGNAPIALFALDHLGLIKMSEGRVLETIGLALGEMVGRSALDLFRETPEIAGAARRALAGKAASGVVDGQTRSFEIRFTPIADADGRLQEVIGVATDISERRQADQQSRRLVDQLARTDQISTLGEMASGLAHELSQPLAAIVAYSDACQELAAAQKLSKQQLVELLRAVSSQADRAGQIIHRLRQMIKRTRPLRSPINVNQAVRAVAALFEAEARKSGISVHLDLAAELPDTLADFVQIQQVVLNLIRNGLESLAEAPEASRQLTISTSRTSAGEVEIAVCDLGNGLTGDAAARLFEPFFSTKPDRLGMGLSVARTIVESHGGRIRIASNSTRGVTILCTLSAVDGFS